LLKVKPFTEKGQNIVEIFNETIILLIATMMIFLTSVSEPGKLREVTAWIAISGFCVIATTNIGYIIFQKGKLALD
jgi:hypothetical protein